ncbi:hypothetical protein G210_5806 [Candida maltosa Xu316]|uniref:TOG domain-containing protein n=1 Tax=Candida maltosa (strain Xu316) TaxID=1245528 RepID=M3HPM4_CANMX|nr:hypothetical protein G210_5806 [Candida maltosa Xu316]
MTDSWEQLDPIYEKGIQDSLTSVRVPVLASIKSVVSDIPEQDLNKVAIILLKTYNYYHDAKSRNEVLSTLQAIGNHIPKYFQVYVKFINQQVDGPTLPITDYMTLLQWINAFSIDLAKLGVGVEDSVAIAQGKLLSRCITFEGRRRRIYKSAIQTTKTAIVDTLFIDAKYLDVVVRNKSFALLGVLDSALEKHPGLAEVYKEKYCEDILDFFVNHALLSKTAPPSHDLALFGNCIKTLFTDFSKLLPNIEKSILRSSENAFVYTLPVLFENLSIDIEVTPKLLNSIISGIKSTKEQVRKGASCTLDLALQKNTSDLVDEIFKAIKATSNVESKALIIKSLVYFKDSEKIVNLLLPLVSKDQNEISLASLVKVITFHALKFNNQDVIKQFITGFNSKLRRVWFIEFAEQVDTVVFDEFVPEFEKILKQIEDSPLPSVSNKSIVCAFIILALTGRNSPLLNDARLFSKLDEVDLKWLVKALKNDPLGWIYVLTNSPYNIRLMALDTIKLNDELCQGLIKECLHGDIKHLGPVFVKLTEYSGAILKDLILPASKANINWITLGQRAKIDLGELVRENFESIFNECVKDGSPEAIKAIVDLAFIQPEMIQPIVSLLDFDTNELEFDDQEIKIYEAPEGELVVNVLSEKQLDKNTKDYEIKKWEESIKKELKQPKKLSKEEQALVNEQLAKESEIRNRVANVVNKVNFVISLIIQLTNQAKLVNNGANLWFPAAVNKLLALPHSSLFNPVDAFLNMAELLSSRIGILKKFIGVATLRSYKFKLDESLEQESLISLSGRILYRIKMLSDQQPLDSLSLSYILPLLIKVLYDGKAVAIKNSSKSAVTSEFVEEDPEEEQLLLAVEIISAHAESFEDEKIPRTSILEVSISLMQLPSKAKLSKECFLSLCQHIAYNISPNDLQLLLSNLITPQVFVRSTILEGLDAEFELENYSKELFVATHDNDQNCREIAQTIWEDNELKVEGTSNLLSLFGNTDAGLRNSIANAYVDAAIQTGLNNQELFELYHEKLNPPAPKLDKFGLVIKATIDNRDRWEERSTVAIALKLLAPLYSESDIESLFKFLVDTSDKDELVRQELQDAGVEAIKLHGSENVEVLIPIFEESLAKSSKEAVVVLYGTLARDLAKTDPRLKIIIDRLMKSLDTPVQYAVSECIAPLVPSMDNLQQVFDDLFEKLWTAKKLSSRRGAAYGISGLVKGSGIKSLSSFDVIRNLTDAADEKDPIKRESVSICFETLSKSLGKYFEPYVIEILPIILKSLGDPAPEVRLATDNAAKEIMKNTTSFGIKKLIPLAISNLDEIAWRSKKGSVELLGSMAYLDPAQLSASLSIIIPQIVGVLNDTHKEVRKTASASLQRFGEVIRNPEIQAIVPDLINAIGDPTKYTDEALDKLIKTQFVHYIDGPSLALIIHVIYRGMKDRASTKKKACQIVGNMAILVDAKDLHPYLSELVHELEIAMVDPVPATRSTAARALGSLVEKLGEDSFPGLIPKLLDTLQDDTKTGDRLGSAQALAEVISGLGITKLEEMLPFILSSASAPRTRAGFMPLLLFLPVCFGSQFSPYLSKIIPPILKGLADQDEEIRDTALRAGRLIVKNYAKKAVDLLLPELENGLSDSSYRIRLSSVELTGDLLFQITGISGKNEVTEDQSVNRTLVEVLGQERRDRVLASLFVCRSDVAGIVRNATVDIWKALVSNTPRTVKEILPSLTSIVVNRLSSEDDIQRTIAAQTLGEMVRRVGANALAQLLPTLQESDDKQGVCIAITELIKSTSHDGLVEYQDIFIEIIKDGLVTAREEAALAFDVLQDELGKVVIDEIVPDLLKRLKDPNALLAMKDIMSKKADVIFPILLPTLLTPPIDAEALASLAPVAGSALYKRLSVIINALVDAQSEAVDEVMLSVEDDGVHQLMQIVMSLLKDEDTKRRIFIFSRLSHFFENTDIDYSMYLEDMVSRLILSLADPSPEVVQGAFEALSALVKKQPKESLEKLVKPAKQTLDLCIDIPAFKLPKGPNCILPIFLHGLMYGNQKEAAALGIADIIDKTPADNLRPFSTTMTGPLIRVIGEKVSSDIKAAILVALNNLLLKIPQFLRPFIPQLQRTFVRSLSDNNANLRKRAVVALGTLIKFQPRVDSLVTELVNGSKTSEFKDSMLEAMLVVVEQAGKNLSEASKQAILAVAEKEMDPVLIGSLAGSLSDEEAQNILKNVVATESKFSILAINSFLKYSPDHITKNESAIDFVAHCADSNNAYMSDNATIAIGKLILLGVENQELINQLAVNIIQPKSSSPDTRRLSLVVVRTAARKVGITDLDTIVPSIFASIRDPIIPIKLAAEKAYLEVFDMVTKGNEKFDSWFKDENVTTVTGTTIVARSISDYTKRVATRLAGVERERIEAGGDDETLFSDRIEDENEIWQVGV